MKVRFQEDYKDFYTINEVRSCRIMMDELKIYSNTEANEAATKACELVFGVRNARVLEAEAVTEINKRCYVYRDNMDFYAPGTGYADVRIHAYLHKPYTDSIFEISFLLTDLYMIKGDDPETIDTLKEGGFFYEYKRGR